MKEEEETKLTPRLLVAAAAGAIGGLLLLLLLVFVVSPRQLSAQRLDALAKPEIRGNDTGATENGLAIEGAIDDEALAKVVPPIPFVPVNNKAVQTLAEFRRQTVGQVRVVDPAVQHRRQIPVFFSALKLENPRILYIHHTLSPAACEAIIAYAKSRIERSHVINLKAPGGNEESTVRTSSGMFITEPDGINSWFNKELHAVASAVTGLPSSNFEATQVLRYDAGQYYKAHEDYFDPDDFANLNRGGQRIATMLTWLNDCRDGGGTSFPNAGIEIRPRKGDSVLFYDADAQGNPDRGSLHGGNPPGPGESKWVAVVWMHPVPFA
jgi:hypothetical protein